MDKQVLTKVLGWGSVGFGVAAAAAPEQLLTGYRFRSNPEVRRMTRLWGTRNITLGALLLAAQGREIDNLLLSAAVLNGIDAVLEFAGNALDGGSGPGGAMAGATSASFGALAAYARGR